MSNFTRFSDCQGNIFWFSYNTLVAFKTIGKNIVVHENVWKTTTGKHLNSIDGGGKEAKKLRLTKEYFNRALEEELTRFILKPWIERL